MECFPSLMLTLPTFCHLLDSMQVITTNSPLSLEKGLPKLKQIALFTGQMEYCHLWEDPQGGPQKSCQNEKCSEKLLDHVRILLVAH